MTLHMALMLHELGTNSAKYGALSAPGGWVTVSWTVTDGVLNLQWVERGGPAVAAPTTRGFGTTLIEQSARSEGGKAQMLCEAAGITWHVSVPLPGPEASVASALEAEWVEASAPQKPATATRSNRPTLSGRRLLVVEDEPLVALDIVSGLQDAGAEIAGPAGTEKDALQIVETTALDAALLDANLHGRPVDQVAAALTRRNVPFVFISGHTREGLPAAFASAPLLGKPFSHQQLVEAVGRLLQRNDNVARFKGSPHRD
jgi:CheY-like chemotaxis protein